MLVITVTKAVKVGHVSRAISAVEQGRSDLCIEPSCPLSLYKGAAECPCLQTSQTSTSKKIVPAATQVPPELACCMKLWVSQ